MSRAVGWLLFLALASCTRSDRVELEPAPTREAIPLAKSGSPTSSSVPPVTTPPPAGSAAAAASKRPAGAVRFAVIGDFGADGPDEAHVASMVKSWKPDFVITTGDDNYPKGEASTIDPNIGKYYAEFIGDYHGAYGPGSQTNRFWPSPGNHDWMSGLGPYLEYFTLPGNERYYDADLGLVHLFALDSDPHEPDGVNAESTQGLWLKDRLAKSKACYDLVYFHHPAYSSSRHGSTEYMRWPFHDWGAEAVLAGHDHTYERFSADGIPYFVIGLGGASKYDLRESALPETKFRFNNDFGAMLVDATKTNIRYEFYSVDGVKRDSFTVPAAAGCAK